MLHLFSGCPTENGNQAVVLMTAAVAVFSEQQQEENPTRQERGGEGSGRLGGRVEGESIPAG